jgi:hypothetical protein
MTDIPEKALTSFERWPGYNEQSWSERFAELDRRYGQQAQHIFTALARPTPRPEGDAVERVARAIATYDYADGQEEPWQPFTGQARAAIAAMPIREEATRPTSAAMGGEAERLLADAIVLIGKVAASKPDWCAGEVDAFQRAVQSALTHPAKPAQSEEVGLLREVLQEARTVMNKYHSWIMRRDLDMWADCPDENMEDTIERIEAALTPTVEVDGEGK